MELSFNNEELFNNEILKQYDDDGQLGLLGYLIRNKEFIIEDNSIIFPTLTSQSKIRQVIDEYSKECVKKYLEAQKEILDQVIVVDIKDVKDRIEDRLNELEKKKYEQDRY